VDAAALKWLKNLPLPGNIRQLKNLVERVALLTSSDQVGLADFQKYLPPAQPVQAAGSFPEVGSLTLEEMEYQMITRAMALHNNRVTEVARALGITRFALYRRLEKYAIPYDSNG
jgi:DNA-binding NtrC family response regulator